MKKRPGLVHLRKLDLIFHVDLQIKQIEKVCLRFGMPIIHRGHCTRLVFERKY